MMSEWEKSMAVRQRKIKEVWLAIFGFCREVTGVEERKSAIGGATRTKSIERRDWINFYNLYLNSVTVKVTRKFPRSGLRALPNQSSMTFMTINDYVRRKCTWYNWSNSNCTLGSSFDQPNYWAIISFPKYLLVSPINKEGCTCRLIRLNSTSYGICQRRHDQIPVGDDRSVSFHHIFLLHRR